MSSRISVSSTEWVRITADPIRDGSAFDPTSDPVELAFPMAGVAPVTGDWHDAEWELTKPPYVARVLIGPDGDVQLDEGSYDVYLRVTDGAEKPSILADRVVIYSTPALLASVLDLADRVPELNLAAEDPAATRALEEATDFIRAYTSQVFVLVEDDIADLRGTWDAELWLPQRPVLSLTGVSVRGPGQGAFTVHDAALYTAERRGLVLRSGGWFGPQATLRVTYSHGFEQIPPEISRVCCSIAARALASGGGGGDIESESKSIGTFSHAVTYSAGQRSVGLTAQEARILDRWRAWGIYH